MANPEGLATMSENAKVDITEAGEQRRERYDVVKPFFHFSNLSL
jgi:hypothetical protein